MLIDTYDVGNDRPMTAFEVDPKNMPSAGDRVEIESSALTQPTVWVIEGIVWTGHPEQLRPKAFRLRCESRGLTAVKAA